MSAVKQCQTCSAEIPSDAPGGSCPQCLIALGMQGLSPADGEAATAAAAHRIYPVPAAEQLVGKFPNLEIEHLVGQGGMGAVYQARQSNLDRTVALKILSPQLNSNPAFAERFTREAKTLAKLAHANIVTVFDFGEVDSMHYLVMEFVDGVNLRDTIESTRFSATEALATIGQICDALQYAHDHGVVHRDIKPENILITKSGHVKIADFGLAKLLEPSADQFTLTNTRQVLGTLKYMAPEQIEKPEQVDHRADLYSLGVVFYELLTGELPIGRFAVPSAKAEINHRLDDVVLKTLEKEPDHRYQQASQIKTAVEAAELAGIAAGSEPLHAQPAGGGHAPKTPALPFKTDDVYAGMAHCFGIARIREPDVLEIEFEVQDGFGVTKSAAKTVDIPIDKLATIQFKSGIFSDTVSLQAETMSAVTEIPSAKHGHLNLYTSKSDLDLVNQFVARIKQLMPASVDAAAGFTATSPTAPVKHGSLGPSDVSEDDWFQVDERLRFPVLGMFVTGVIHLVLAVFLSFVMFRQTIAGTDKIDVICGKVLKLLGNVLYVDGASEIFWSALISLGFAIVLLVVASQLHARKNYSLVMVGSILACAPIHPLAVLTLPLAIWALAVIDTPVTSRVFRHNEAAIASSRRRRRSQSNSGVWWMVAIASSLILIFAVGGILMVMMYSRSTQTTLAPEPTTVVVDADNLAEVSSSATESNVVVQSGDVQSQNVRLSFAGILMMVVFGALCLGGLALLIGVIFLFRAQAKKVEI